MQNLEAQMGDLVVTTVKFASFDYFYNLVHPLNTAQISENLSPIKWNWFTYSAVMMSLQNTFK